jgi:broad specificity phosphatase PhoE
MASKDDLKATSALHHGDSALSRTGEKQLKFALTSKAIDFQIFSPYIVLCSPLQRALRTALVAYPDHKIVVDPCLREIHCDAGMTKDTLQAFIQTSRPERKAKVDLARVPNAAWWSAVPTECPIRARRRVQRVLKHIHKNTLKGKKVAVVGHSILFKMMVGGPKPFPTVWGSPRGWPKNFRPYHCRFADDAAAELKLTAASVEKEATVVLIRHAHSSAQAARTLLKKNSKQLKEE